MMQFIETNKYKRNKISNRQSNILELKSENRFSTDEIYEKFHKFGKICGLYDNKETLLIVYLMPKEAEEALKYFINDKTFSLEYFYL